RFAASAGGEVADAFDYLHLNYGPDSTRRVLEHFLARRGDWWAYAGDDADGADGEGVARTLAALREGMPGAPDEDVPAGLMADTALREQLKEFAALLARNTEGDRKLAARLDAAVADTGSDAGAWLRQVSAAFLTAAGELRARKASAAQRKRLGDAGEARYL